MASFLQHTLAYFGYEKRSSIVPVGPYNIDIRNGNTLWNLIGGVGSGNAANVAVTAETANKLSAFYSCVRNISEDIAKLPFTIQLKDSQGNKIDQPSHAASKLLNIKPNGFSSPLTLKQTLIDRALRRGNGYAVIIRDDDATPIQMLFVETEGVIPVLGDDLKMYYIINDPLLKITGTYSGDDVFHLRGMGNAYQGLSVLAYAAESIGKALATQQYAGKYYGSGANMSGLLKITGAKNEEDARKIKESFLRSYEKDGIGALQGAAEFIKMNFSADEAQMLGSQEFNVKDVARWFRMPLSKLQTSDQIANIEALAIEYVNDCLEPWITRFEEEVNLKLTTEKEKGIYSARIDTWPLLTGDSAAQERRLKTWFMIGGQTQNQLLRSMGMNGIGPAGDRTWVPVNMIPEEMANDFWASKTPETTPLDSPDSSGSGATNGNVKQSQS